MTREILRSVAREMTRTKTSRRARAALASGMLRLACLLLLVTFPALAQDDNDAPPISITSPDTGVTFAFGTVKSHTLVWDKGTKMLLAEVTFIDRDDGGPEQTVEDTHTFRLPGVTYDEARKVFIATSSRGAQIPVATL